MSTKGSHLASVRVFVKKYIIELETSWTSAGKPMLVWQYMSSIPMHFRHSITHIKPIGYESLC
jgi:hypothetical protein